MDTQFLVIIRHRHSRIRYLYSVSAVTQLLATHNAWLKFEKQFDIVATDKDDWQLSALEIPLDIVPKYICELD